MIALAEGSRSRRSRGGVVPSMDGSADDEVLAFAEHLQEHAPLGLDGKEAFRMANAQHEHHKTATMRKAVEIAVRELLLMTKAA